MLKKKKRAPKKTPQDPDVKDVEGTQPKKYYKGLSKDTKDARASHFKNRDTSKNDNRPAPGDADAKTKPSKHTLKFKRMYEQKKLMCKKIRVGIRTSKLV